MTLGGALRVHYSYMAAGPASRLGSTEPREKTGLRLSPYLVTTVL